MVGGRGPGRVGDAAAIVAEPVAPAVRVAGGAGSGRSDGTERPAGGASSGPEARGDTTPAEEPLGRPGGRTTPRGALQRPTDGVGLGERWERLARPALVRRTSRRGIMRGWLSPRS